MSILYIGHRRTADDNLTTRKVYGDGTLIWSKDHGNHVAAIAVDSDGYVYTGGRSATSDYYNAVRKYDSDGTEITDGWPISVGSANPVACLAIDEDGNVYVGSVYTNSTSKMIQKYASSGGDVIWQTYQEHVGGSVRGLAITDDGHLIAVGDRSSNKSLWKVDRSTGEVIWYADHGGNLRSVAVDSLGNIYTGGYAVSSVTTRKWTDDGSEMTDDDWPINGGGTILSIATADGMVVTGGLLDSSITTRAYQASDGAALWTANHGNTVNVVAIDDAGAVYTGGVLSSSVNIRKYDSDGTEITITWPGGTPEAFFMGPSPPLTASSPGLAFSLALSLPTLKMSHIVSGMALSLAFGAPTVTEPPIPPIGDGQAIYRGYLTGLSSLIEIPLVSIQCRKRQDDSTWLTVQSPGSAAWLATVISALAAGGQLVIYSGQRASNGAETLGEFLRATLTDYEAEQTPGDWTITLQARVDAQLEVLQTRVMAGIAQRFQEQARRKIRCQINPLLRPGDTVDAGDATWIAHNILYRIDAYSAWMDVQEPPLG